MNDQYCLIYLHIPKTAGSTVHTILNAAYKTKDIYNVFGSTMSEPGIQSFLSLPEPDRSRLQLVKGHMPFGLHEFIPGESRYFGFIRHPVDRIISLYHYILRSKQNKFHALLTENRMSLTDFMDRRIALGTDNGNIRFLINGFTDIPFGEVNESHLELAKRNIDRHFILLGLTERFDETMLALAILCNWRRLPLYRRRNTTKGRTSLAGWNPTEAGMIEERNRLDMELYGYATALFDRRIGSIENFDEQLRKYQRVNRAYQVLTAPLALLER